MIDNFVAEIVCPRLDHIQYGYVKAAGYYPSSVAHYGCDDGYVLYGLTQRKCLHDGTWYGKAPICKKSKQLPNPWFSIQQPMIMTDNFAAEIVCPHLPGPQYGSVRLTGYEPSAKAYYACDHGYSLYGLRWRKCRPDGTWYGKAPTCHPRKYN